MSTFKDFVAIVKGSVAGFIEDDVLTMSAALAYYAAFSLAPLLLIVVSIAGAAYGDKAVNGMLDVQLRRAMGPGSAEFIQKMVAGASKPSDSIIMSIVGGVLLLVGAGGVFGQLQGALNKIWKVKAAPARGFKGMVIDRFMSFSMVLVTGFLLLISMLLSTTLQAVGERLGELTGLPVGTWLAGSGILSFVVVTLLFASIFKVLPNVPIGWRDVWAGALFTAVLFMAGKIGIAWYLGHQATGSTYGSAGSFVVLLTWLYYSSIILLFGAEFTESHAHQRGRDFEISSAITRPKPIPNR